MMDRCSLRGALRTGAVVFCILVMGLLAPPRAGAFTGDFDFDGVMDAVEVYGGSDGTSPLSIAESLTFAIAGLTAPLACVDGLDNDGDTLIDGADPGCLNSDGDLVGPYPSDDTLEANLGSIPVLPLSTPEHWFVDMTLAPVTCANLLDDDADGPIDFPADSSCLIDVDLDGFPALAGDTEGGIIANTSGLFGTSDCFDGVDNDGDGFPDIFEPGCVDNDGDGFANTIDTEGPQGTGSGAGVAEGDDCYDGVDNDGDAVVDALEPDCALCYGLVPTISGGPGNDLLVGTAGPDVIMGFTGDDRIRGLDGDDIICAGPGNDRVRGNNDNDYVSGSDGNDILVGNMGVDNLDGDAGDDIVRGNAGFDTLLGGAGGDRLIAGPDGDVAIGDAGNDIIRGAGGDDFFLSGGDGDDDVRGGGGNDAVFGDAGNDFLRGNGGDDTIFGGGDDDNMTGGGGLLDSCDGGPGLLDVAPGTSCETVLNVP